MGVVLLGALLPTLSHAAARWANPGAWVEICTSTGMVWVHTQSGESADAPPESPGVSSMVGCTWCLLQGGSAGLPPNSSKAPLEAWISTQAPVFGLSGPLSPPPWPSALTRAPPQLT